MLLVVTDGVFSLCFAAGTSYSPQENSHNHSSLHSSNSHSNPSKTSDTVSVVYVFVLDQTSFFLFFITIDGPELFLGCICCSMVSQLLMLSFVVYSWCKHGETMNIPSLLILITFCVLCFGVYFVWGFFSSKKHLLIARKQHTVSMPLSFHFLCNSPTCFHYQQR